ncbi:MAG: hypothetical protein FWC47_17460 [Oscillospiraceae bacterium]|nr:hypothetical protein [Oscillospiraceae bacterium]
MKDELNTIIKNVKEIQENITEFKEDIDILEERTYRNEKRIKELQHSKEA